MEQKWPGPYISRKEVVQFIEKGLNNPDKTNAFGHDAVEILTEVQFMPAADVKPVVRGEWIKARQDNPMCSEFRCSQCGFQIDVGDPNGLEDLEMYFCQRCGAELQNNKKESIREKRKARKKRA